MQNEVYGQDEYLMGGRTPGHMTPLRSPYSAGFGTPGRMNPEAMNSPLKSPLAGLNFGGFSPLAGGGFSPTRSPGDGLGGYSPTSPGLPQPASFTSYADSLLYAAVDVCAVSMQVVSCNTKACTECTKPALLYWQLCQVVGHVTSCLQCMCCQGCITGTVVWICSLRFWSCSIRRL